VTAFLLGSLDYAGPVQLALCVCMHVGVCAPSASICLHLPPSIYIVLKKCQFLELFGDFWNFLVLKIADLATRTARTGCEIDNRVADCFRNNN